MLTVLADAHEQHRFLLVNAGQVEQVGILVMSQGTIRIGGVNIIGMHNHQRTSRQLGSQRVSVCRVKRGRYRFVTKCMVHILLPAVYSLSPAGAMRNHVFRLLFP